MLQKLTWTIRNWGWPLTWIKVKNTSYTSCKNKAVYSTKKNFLFHLTHQIKFTVTFGISWKDYWETHGTIFLLMGKNSIKLWIESPRSSERKNLPQKPNINPSQVSLEDSKTIQHEYYRTVQDNSNHKKYLPHINSGGERLGYY